MTAGTPGRRWTRCRLRSRSRTCECARLRARTPPCQLAHPRRAAASDIRSAPRDGARGQRRGPGRAFVGRDVAGAGPARARDPAARVAARPGHRGAGRRRAARSRRARPADDDPAAARGRRRGAGGSRRAAGRPRPRPCGGRHPGVQPLLPAREPRRGARPGPIVPAAANGRAARTRSGLRSRRSAGAARTATTRASSSPRLRITPVLTAHPTEARRRTLLLAIRRVERQLARLEDPLLDAGRGPRSATPPPRGDHAALANRRPPGGRRRRRSTRSGPRSRSSTRRCSAPCRASCGRSTPRSTAPRVAVVDVPRPPLLPPMPRPATPAGPGRGRRWCRRSSRWGSWIGGDRDGNPTVTAEVTERTMRIHADHVLRGYEAVATRLSSDDRRGDAGPARPARSRTRLARDAELLPETDRDPRPALPERAVPPAVRVHRRAAPPDAGVPDRPAGAADRPLRVGGGARRRAGRDPGRARRRRTRTVGVGRGPGPALAARDVRVPPRGARDPPAQRGRSGGARGAGGVADDDRRARR